MRLTPRRSPSINLRVMGDLFYLLTAAGPAFAYAAAVRPLLHLQSRIGWIVAICTVAAVPSFALLIPADKRVLRGIALFWCGELLFKLIDYARERRQPVGDTISYAQYLHFLIPFPMLLVVYRDKKWSGVKWPSLVEMLRIPVFAGLIFLVFQTMFAMEHVVLLQASFWLDHAVKLLMFVATLEIGSRLLMDLERIAGYETKPIMRNILLSRTVGEFWTRYNTRINAWMEANVFRPSGGRTHRVRGVLLTFFVSALLHEVMFDLATSKPDGTQFIFFMLQAPAVLLSAPLERLGRRGALAGKLLAHGLTLTWFYFTSIFFFHAVERIFPFMYASEPVLW